MKFERMGATPESSRDAAAAESPHGLKDERETPHPFEEPILHRPRTEENYRRILTEHPTLARVQVDDMNVFIQYGNHSEGEPVPESLPVDAFAFELAGINFSAGSSDAQRAHAYAERFTRDLIHNDVRPQISYALARAKETGAPVYFVDTPPLRQIVQQEHRKLEHDMDDHRYLQLALGAGSLALLVSMVQDVLCDRDEQDAAQERSFTRRSLLRVLGLSTAATAIRAIHMGEHAGTTHIELYDSSNPNEQAYRRASQQLSEAFFKDAHLFSTIYRDLVWAQKMSTAHTLMHPEGTDTNMFLIAGAFHTGAERALRMDEADRLTVIEELMTKLDTLDPRYTHGTEVISILQHGPAISDALCDAGAVPVASVEQWQFAYIQDPGLRAVVERVHARRVPESSEGK